MAIAPLPDAAPLPDPAPAIVAGVARTELGGGTLVVRDAWTGGAAATIPAAGSAVLEQAIAGAEAATPAWRDAPAHRRAAVLERIAVAVEEDGTRFATILEVEAGKLPTDAAGEVARCIETFRVAAEEARRIGGEIVPLDRTPRGEGRVAVSRRMPVGPCGFITPFNFPLNLVAHKVAPAIAAGCPFVLKPAEVAPLSALALVEVAVAAAAAEGLDPRGLSVVPCGRDEAAPVVRDPRLRLLSFTGSHRVGWRLRSEAGPKRVHLELGGNAALLVEPDADLEAAVEAIVTGGFGQAGQSCISVQRVLVRRELVERVRDAVVGRARAFGFARVADRGRADLAAGRAVVGPMIDVAAAERVESWIIDACAAGADVLAGGERDGAFLAPTIVVSCPEAALLWAEEAFGPVVVLEPYDALDEGIAKVNASRYGLQAAVFTHDLRTVRRAWERLEVGAVIVNEAPTWRADHMPYGGVKESGLGREGPRSAIEAMTEPRLLVVAGD